MSLLGSIKSFYEKHPLRTNLAILVATIIALTLPYLLDYKLPFGFMSDLSSEYKWFLEVTLFLKKGEILPLSWDVLYSSANYSLNIYSMFHYLFFVIFNGNTVYTYKVYIIFEIFVCGLSMLFVSYKLSGHRFGSLLAAIFYILTPYFLYELTAHIYYLWGYALLPLAYYLIYLALINKSIKFAILAGLALVAVTIFATTELIYENGIPLAIFSLLIIIFHFNPKNIKKETKTVLVRIGLLLIVIIVTLLLSAYIIVGTYTSSGVPATNTFSQYQQLSAYSNNFWQSFFLLPTNSTFSNTFIPVVILLPILSVILLFFERKKLYYITLITGLFAVALSVGINTPLWVALTRFLPIFNDIQVAYRFLITVSMVFSMMAGISIDVILTKLFHMYQARPKFTQKNRINKIKLFHKNRENNSHGFQSLIWHSKIKILLALAIIIIILIPISYVFFEANLAYSNIGPLTSYEPQISPQDSYVVQLNPSFYSAIENWLDNADPQHTYRVIDLASPDGKLFSFDQSAFDYLYSVDLFFTYYQSPSFAQILSQFGVKYIVCLNNTQGFLGNDIGNEISFAEINNVLSNSSNFKVAYQLENVVIYENKLTMPWIYLASGVLTVGGPQALSLFDTLNTTQNWTLIYADQLSNDQLQNFSSFKTILFEDTDITDLASMKINNFIDPSNYIDIENPDGWQIVRTYSFTVDHPFLRVQNAKDGEMGFSNYFAYTDETASLRMPISVTQTGNYSIWIRVLGTSNDSISLTIDSGQTATASLTNASGFQWIKISAYLEKGTHQLLIQNDQPISLYLDVVSLVSQQQLQSQIDQLTTMINQAGLNTLYLLDCANFFSGQNTYDTQEMSSFASAENSGTLLMEPNSTATANLYFATDGNYTLGLRLVAPSGNIKILLDNTTIYQGSITSSTANWVWLTINSVFISTGDHTITIENSINDSNLDFMYISTTANTETAIAQNLNSSSTSIESYSPILFPEDNIGTVNFTQTGLLNWAGNVKANETAFLVFLESYVPDRWFAQIENYSLSDTPLPANYIFNAFPINLTISQFEISYSQPLLITTSQLVSAISGIIVASTIVMIYFEIRRDKKQK